MDNTELQKKHFAALKRKYQQSDQYKNVTSDILLYLILRKVELGIQVTDFEYQWLAENQLFKTIELISLQEYQAEERKRLNTEFWRLRTRYQIPQELEISISSPLYPILCKFDSGCLLTDSELKFIKEQNFTDTLALIEKSREFVKLKVKYKATQHLQFLPEYPLYSILKKLENKEPLLESEADWLLNFNFHETLEIYWQQENTRKAEIEFLELKTKYQVEYEQNCSITSPLYLILKTLDNGEELSQKYQDWLKKKKMYELIKKDEEQRRKKLLYQLKKHYKASIYSDNNPSTQLFEILVKIAFCDSSLTHLISGIIALPDDLKSDLSYLDIQWLIEEGLIETAEIAKQVHFRILKKKYQIVGQLEIEPYYEIMLKLERQERLDPKQVIQLIEEKQLYREGKIALAYYTLEARFYEQEYKRTGNRWNLPSASSNWRKAREPEKALKATENVNWKKIKESDLKSALLVTRGATFRDVDQLYEAEKCAAEAMNCQPENHQPYTLMGATCYSQGKYLEGDNWFKMAVERGADNVEDEIERIVRMTKDKQKRREAAEYLFNKDLVQYKWAKSYLDLDKSENH